MSGGEAKIFLNHHQQSFLKEVNKQMHTCLRSECYRAAGRLAVRPAPELVYLMGVHAGSRTHSGHKLILLYYFPVIPGVLLSMTYSL